MSSQESPIFFATRLAARIGLIRTRGHHLPLNVLLILAPLMPERSAAGGFMVIARTTRPSALCLSGSCSRSFLDHRTVLSRGRLKILYDLLLYKKSASIPPHEERAVKAPQPAGT
jgi:hypothetical protein